MNADEDFTLPRAKGTRHQSWQTKIVLVIWVIALFALLIFLASILAPSSPAWYVLLPVGFLLSPWICVGLGLSLFPIQDHVKAVPIGRPKSSSKQFKIRSLMWLILVAAVLSSLMSFALKSFAAGILVFVGLAFFGPWVVVGIAISRHPLPDDAEKPPR